MIQCLVGKIKKDSYHSNSEMQIPTDMRISLWFLSRHIISPLLCAARNFLKRDKYNSALRLICFDISVPSGYNVVLLNRLRPYFCSFFYASAHQLRASFFKWYNTVRVSNEQTKTKFIVHGVF
jgi:hypothetical protein